MRESRTPGSARGVLSNGHSYRNFFVRGVHRYRSGTHAALYSSDGNEPDLAEPVSLVARLTQAARFHTYIYNVMPPVLAAFLFLRA